MNKTSIFLITLLVSAGLKNSVCAMQKSSGPETSDGDAREHKGFKGESFRLDGPHRSLSAGNSRTSSPRKQRSSSRNSPLHGSGKKFFTSTQNNEGSPRAERLEPRKSLYFFGQDGVVQKVVHLKETDGKINFDYFFKKLKQYNTQYLLFHDVDVLTKLENDLQHQMTSNLDPSEKACPSFLEKTLKDLRITPLCSLQNDLEEFCRNVQTTAHRPDVAVLYASNDDHFTYVALACSAISRVIGYMKYRNDVITINNEAIAIKAFLDKKNTLYEGLTDLVDYILELVYARVLPNGYTPDDILEPEEQDLVRNWCIQKIYRPHGEES